MPNFWFVSTCAWYTKHTSLFCVIVIIWGYLSASVVTYYFLLSFVKCRGFVERNRSVENNLHSIFSRILFFFTSHIACCTIYACKYFYCILSAVLLAFSNTSFPKIFQCPVNKCTFFTELNYDHINLITDFTWILNKKKSCSSLYICLSPLSCKNTFF